MREYRPFLSLVMTTLVALAAIGTLPTIARGMFDTTRDITQPADAPAASTPPASAPSQSADWTTVVTVGGIAVAVIIAIALVMLTARYLIPTVARRRAARGSQMRYEQARRAAQIELWQLGLHALAETSDAITAFETDPESLYFTRPLLADVNEPTTAAFYDAYEAARILRTDTIPADNEMIIAFTDAANAARRAFGVADDNARRKARLGIAHDDRRLTVDERRKIDQAHKLMRQAHDPALTEQHAHNALAKSLSLLDAAGIIVPERLTAKVTKSIETIHRPALTTMSADQRRPRQC